jgi:hypothetical protein
MRRIASFFLVVAALSAQNTSKYPGTVATQADLGVAGNRAETTLRTGAGSTDTSLTVASGTQFRAGMYVTVDNEFIAICGVSGNTLTVGRSSCPNVDGRGLDIANGGGAATAHLAGAKVQGRISAWHHNQVAAEVRAVEDALKNGIQHDLKVNGNVAIQTALPSGVPSGGLLASPSYGWLGTTTHGWTWLDWRGDSRAAGNRFDAEVTTPDPTASTNHIQYFGGQIDAAPNAELDAYVFHPRIKRAASGTHPGPIIGVGITSPIDMGGTAMSDAGAATLYIESDPPHTFAPGNWYALWVNSGQNYFGNNILFGNPDVGIHNISNAGSKTLILWSDNGPVSLGALGAERALLSNTTLAATTNLTLTRSEPLIDLIGTEGSARTVRLQESGGSFNVLDMTAVSYLFQASVSGFQANHGITVGANASIDTGGGARFASLSGTGTRPVFAGATGTLSVGTAGLSVTKTMKGSDGNNCNLVFTAGLLTSTTCP